jgi:hypothetical protein
MSCLAIPIAYEEPRNFVKELRMQRATLGTTGRRIGAMTALLSCVELAPAFSQPSVAQLKLAYGEDLALGEVMDLDMLNHAMLVGVPTKRGIVGTDGVVGTD